MANKGSVSCSQTISTVFATGETSDIIMQNVGASSVFVSWDTAEVDKGLRIAPGESVNTADLTPVWRASMSGGLTAICNTGETTTLLWTR